MKWYRIAGQATDGVLAVLYSIVIVICLLSWFRRYHPKTTMIRTFILLAGTGACFRVLYFAIPNKVFKAREVPQDIKHYSEAFWLQAVQSILFMIPNVLFYGTYIIIVFFWAQAYSNLKRRKVKQNKFLRFYKILILGYAVTQLLLVVIMVSANYFVFLLVHAVILVILSLGASFSFVYFYKQLDTQLSSLFSSRSTSDALTPEMVNSPEQTRIDQDRREKLKKIMHVAFVCAGTQTFRAGVLIYEMYAAVTGNFPKKFWWSIVGVYYVVSEVFVALSVLWILRQRPEPVVKHRSRRQSGRKSIKGHPDRTALLSVDGIAEEEEEDPEQQERRYGTLDARHTGSLNEASETHANWNQQQNTSFDITPQSPSRPTHEGIAGARNYTPSSSPHRLPRAELDRNSLGYPSPPMEKKRSGS